MVPTTCHKVHIVQTLFIWARSGEGVIATSFKATAEIRCPKMLVLGTDNGHRDKHVMIVQGKHWD